MRLEPAPRLPKVSPWVVLVVLCWGAMVAGEILLDRHLGLGMTTCTFRRITGYPCPTCGTTRGSLALLSGHPLVALAFNPMFFGGLFLMAGWFLFRAATGLRPRFDLDRKARRIWQAVAGAGLLLNWIYLLLRGI